MWLFLSVTKSVWSLKSPDWRPWNTAATGWLDHFCYHNLTKLGIIRFKYVPFKRNTMLQVSHRSGVSQHLAKKTNFSCFCSFHRIKVRSNAKYFRTNWPEWTLKATEKCLFIFCNNIERVRPLFPELRAQGEIGTGLNTFHAPLIVLHMLALAQSKQMCCPRTLPFVCSRSSCQRFAW